MSYSVHVRPVTNYGNQNGFDEDGLSITSEYVYVRYSFAEVMKIDRARLRKSSSEIPAECQALIDRLCACSKAELLQELSKINTWTFGKCELYHWAVVLDVFDDILEEAATPKSDNKWALYCDIHYTPKVRVVLFLFISSACSVSLYLTIVY